MQEAAPRSAVWLSLQNSQRDLAGHLLVTTLPPHLCTFPVTKTTNHQDLVSLHSRNAPPGCLEAVGL